MKKFEVVYAPKEAEQICMNASGSGIIYDDEFKDLGLEKDPIVIYERRFSFEQDHIHLSRFDDTNYVQWFGRCADGYHRPIGKILEVKIL